MTNNEIAKDFMSNLMRGKPKHVSDYGIDEQRFANLIFDLQERGYISGVIDASSMEGKNVIVDFCHVTLSGEDYCGSKRQ